jgi:hypothetical protein
MPKRGPRSPAPESFAAFEASALFCPTCRTAQPVRERLLLVLPDGELYEYLCRFCGTSLGERRVREEGHVLLPS